MRLICSILFAAVLGAETAAQELAPPVSDPFYAIGQQTLAERKSVKPIRRKAKNVILFVADGMDPTTVAAARIFDGQSRGEDGEENFLSFERFPHIAMAKTYNTNAQTPDSAGTMTAMVTGVKTKAGIVSLSDAAQRGDCASASRANVPTLAEFAEQAGMATGVVSTARLTHATPAAVFAHAPDRNWESDGDLPAAAIDAGCVDIARQLIEFPYGDGIDVALGGGRRNFLPIEVTDPEDADRKGRRRDGRDLAEEWLAKSDEHVVVFDQAGFDALTAGQRPLGLFESSHMEYEADRLQDAGGEPSLADMTRTAIEILSTNRDGYFLMVEAARVDHAHHGSNAARALKDTQAFSQAVAAARELTDRRDTLIIATADHGHTMAFQGYPAKGNNILGLANTFFRRPANENGYAVASDGKPYTTLAYTNGPGSVFIGDEWEDGRPEPKPAEVADLNYRQQSVIPSPSETHGGQDVTIYADGPHAYLFGGIVEQNYIFHVIYEALDLERAR